MIPVTLIAGYLGAGKTTLINRLLAGADDLSGLAVVVNDFGAVNIDQDLIERNNANDNVIGLQNGCVCCSLKNDLVTTFEQLANAPVDRILLEASGVGLPNRLKQQCTLPGFYARGAVVLIDAVNYQTKRDDKYVGQLVQTQVQEADLLTISKQDSAPDFSYPERDTVPYASLPKILTGTDAFTNVRVIPSSVPHGLESITVRGNQPFDVRAFLKKLPVYVERTKGYLPSLDGMHLVQTSSSGIQSHRSSQCRSEFVMIYPAAKTAAFSEFLQQAVLEFPLDVVE